MNLEPMWEKLAEYQPYAEKHGFGEAWLRMTTERTAEAAWEAAWEASHAARRAAEAGETWKAAWEASHAARRAAEAAANAERATNCITRAIELENEQ